MTQLDKMLPKLKTLRLSGILDTVAVRNQQAVEQKLSYVDFLALLLNDEYDRRENKKLNARLRKANFRPGCTLENFNFDAAGLKINPALIYDLATCRFVEERSNVLMVGPTGVGKSHLAEALGHKACLLGYDVQVLVFSKAMAQLRAGRADGSYERKLQNLCRPDLLILDDFGLKPMTSPADEDFHELICERYQRGSIVLTSNLDFSEWPAVFPNAVLGTATIDRLRDQADRVIIDGESFRKPKAVRGR